MYLSKGGEKSKQCEKQEYISRESDKIEKWQFGGVAWNEVENV
jgi:hypothetical protein